MAAATAPAKKDKKAGKKKERRRSPRVAHIQATFNNTIISIADPEGNVLSWSSAGRIGFKGSRKGTPFAAQVAAQNAAGTAKDGRALGGRDGARARGRPRVGDPRHSVRGIDVKSIKDVTPIPHNGCRPRKRRRV
jgi:small subunit ribosomal protein S11